MVDLIALNRAIARTGKSNEFIADALGLSSQGWLNKRAGKNDFKVTEAQKFGEALGLKNKDLIEIFLTKK